MYISDYGQIIGGLVAVILFIWLICMVFVVLQIIGMWKTFKKAGLNGWAAIIPFYNMYTICKITWGNGWYFLLMFVPLGNIIFMIVTYVKIAKVFGKSGGFAVGLIFLSPIFFMILGCSKETYYLGPDTEGKGKKPAIIATAVLGGFWLICFIISMISGALILSTQMQDIHVVDEGNNSGGIVKIGDDQYEEQELDLSQLEGATEATLDNGYTTIKIPVWEGDYYYNAGSIATYDLDGISVEVSLGYSSLNDSTYGTTLEEEVTRKIKSFEDTYTSMGEYITDVYTDDIQSGNGWVLQQINYSYDIAGDQFPAFDIVKVDDVNGYPMVITISLNNFDSNENTKDSLEQICEAYGVDFAFE